MALLDNVYKQQWLQKHGPHGQSSVCLEAAKIKAWHARIPPTHVQQDYTTSERPPRDLNAYQQLDAIKAVRSASCSTGKAYFTAWHIIPRSLLQALFALIIWNTIYQLPKRMSSALQVLIYLCVSASFEDQPQRSHSLL